MRAGLRVADDEVATVVSFSTGACRLATRFGRAAGSVSRAAAGALRPFAAPTVTGWSGVVTAGTATFFAATCLAASLLLLARLQREDRFMTRDSEYLLYMRRVKYRVLPLVF